MDEQPGQVYTLGYAAPGARERLEALMRDPRVLLVDIRYAARSRWYPAWNKKALKVRWGGRYTHEQRLGNVNYRHKGTPLQLLNPEQSLAGAVLLLRRGHSLVLLCACANEETCHRKLVADLIMQRLKELPGEQEEATGK